MTSQLSPRGPALASHMGKLSLGPGLREPGADLCLRAWGLMTRCWLVRSFCLPWPSRRPWSGVGRVVGWGPIGGKGAWVGAQGSSWAPHVVRIRIFPPSPLAQLTIPSHILFFLAKSSPAPQDIWWVIEPSAQERLRCREPPCWGWGISPGQMPAQGNAPHPVGTTDPPWEPPIKPVVPYLQA